MVREDESIQMAKRELARLEGKKNCIGLYDLEKTLGEGSFARVKAATHILTGSKVAIKIVDKSKLNEEMSEKLRREVRIMKTLNHPHIVKLYEVMETQQEMFLVMEYAEGGELLDYLVAHGRMREKDARKMFRGIVSAIAYCHSKRVIHRDLKAENLLLDMSLNPKIADFGFSNIFSENDMLSTSCGTPAYAAPELFKGCQYTGPELDIWSLGVVLFVLVCGGLPFTASTFAALKAKVIAGSYTIPVFMSTSCEELVKKMLETDPAKRITMEGVLKSEWFNQGFSPMEPFDEATYAVSPERHASILGCMEELGFPRDRVEKSLATGAFNHIFSTYHLLATEISPRIERRSSAEKEPISSKHLEVIERRAAALAAKANQAAQATPPQATAAAAAGGATTPQTSQTSPTSANPNVERPVVKRARGYTVNSVDATQIRKEMTRKPSPLVTQRSDVQGSAPTSPTSPSPTSSRPSSRPTSPPLSPVSHSPSTAEPVNKIPKTDKGRRARAISLQTRALRPALSTLTPTSPTAATPSAEGVSSPNSPPPSPRDHQMEDSSSPAVPSKNAPHVSSPLNPKSAPGPSSGKPFQLRERRLSFKDKFKKTLGLSVKLPLGTSEPPEPKTVRFHFSVQTTSTKAPAGIVEQLEQVLDSFNVAYERENFLFLARKGSVAFELEVCKLPRLALHGVRIKRLAGDSWEYKTICTDILLNLKL